MTADGDEGIYSRLQSLPGQSLGWGEANESLRPENGD
jgi:hypothetical protein